ncbi:MAG: hypothetical protein Q9167_007840 [Letrouitia subvulpina]
MTTTIEIIQDELHGMDITLFPKDGTTSTTVHADVDEDSPYFILQKDILDKLKLQYTQCQAPSYKDKKGRNHTPIGRVNLVWHKPGYHVEHNDTFYVVNSGNPKAAIKRTGKNDTDNAARPLGLGAQSAEDEKRLAQKKAEAEKKRAEEEKKREADEQKQQGQVSGK